MKIAICGLRHDHAKGIIRAARKQKGWELVGVAESAPEACEDILKAAEVEVTHASLEDMLSDVEFDVLALAGIFSQRGAQAIAGLEAGKHILSDKPLCSTLAEIDRIASLAAEKKRSVIAQLTLRYQATWHVARKELLSGAIGDIATVAIFGRHGLKYGKGRPEWFFQEGMQGGTINDLFVHGIDALEWLTGLSVAEIVAARAWNQQLKAVPFFQDAAQAMFRMSNGAGVLMDASYTAPKGHPEPWTVHLNGTEGDLHLDSSGPAILRRRGEPERALEAEGGKTGTPAADLAAEIAGDAPVLTTSASLRATRISLLAQQAADENRTHVPVPSPKG